ncbi:Autotransporter adhesin SadA [Paraburkholderia sacchari]|uniref:YadA-like family protein n=1 Tax=Paraburkholderia sacchari TaxID=159450 RepID=UPI0039A5E8B6
MNKVYRSAYNKVLGTWVAASELTAARGKPARAKSGAMLVAGALLASAGAMSDLANASVAISDNGSKSVQSGTASMAGSAGGIGASASANSIAIVGDGDCNLLTNVDSQKVYGDGLSSSYKGGIYGFGVQKSAASYDDMANAGAGQAGMRGFSPMTAGYVTETGNGVASTQAFGLNSIAMGCGSHANGFGTVAQGWGAVANGAGAVAFGINSTAAGQGAFASGIAANAAGDDSIALGTLASAAANGAIAIGANSVASGEDALASGIGASAEGDYAVAQGRLASATGLGAIAVGSLASSAGIGSIASGLGASAASDDSIAMGTFAEATGNRALALGSTATASAAQSVALGAGSVADRENTVSVGAAGAERQITNVAAGTADTDAVNVSQMKKSGLIAEDGSAKVAVTYDQNADGTADYSNLTLGNNVAGGTTIHNVAAGVADMDAVNVGQLNAAVGNMNSSVDNLNAAVANATSLAEAARNPLFAAYGDKNTEAASATGVYATAAGANASASGMNAVAVGVNASATADNSVALGAGSVANRANTVSVGAAGSERQVTNVAAGTEGTDAVNVNQLDEAKQEAKSYTDRQVSQSVSQGLSGLSDSVHDVLRRSYAGTAAAMAVAGLPQPTQPGKIMVAMAGGRYGGQTGGALGISYVTDNNKWVGKVAANTSTTGNTGVVVGAGYQW